MGSVAKQNAVKKDTEVAIPSLDLYRNLWVISSTPTPAITPLRNETVAISANGITVALALTEPVVYLPQFDPADPAASRSVMLSGNLRLRLTKAIKIKRIELVFKGVAQTKMSNGIFPRKEKIHNVKELNKHVWPLFLAGGQDGLSLFQTSNHLFATTMKVRGTNKATMNFNQNQETMDLSLQANYDYAYGASSGEFWTRRVSSLHQGYKLFAPGDYTYKFEQLIDSHHPETIENEMVSVKWLLQAVVERSGVFRSNLAGIRYIPFIRSPVEGCLEQIEPLAISRNWEGQLHYSITIFGKSFPLGSRIPIAIKLIPFAKVIFRRIQVWVIENLHFRGKANRHVKPIKRFLLFEEMAHSASSSKYPNRAAAVTGKDCIDHNGNECLGGLSQAGPTEIELNVQIPNCQSIEHKGEMEMLHCDATYEGIEIAHQVMVSAYQIKQNIHSFPGYRSLNFILHGLKSIDELR